MSATPPLPFRMLRHGLRVASRAGATVVERVLRRDELEAAPPPAPVAPAGALARAAPRAPVTIRFDGRPVQVEKGATVLEAALDAAVDLRSYCGGNCSCGTCRVEVRSGGRALSRRSGLEEMVLGPEAVTRGDRLACQAQILGDVDVHVPEWF